MANNYREYEEYEREVLDEIDAELMRSHPVHSEFRLERFVSMSNGRGRKPRKEPREVTLVVRLRGGATAWNTAKLDQLGEQLDIETHLTEDEIISELLQGESYPE